MTHRQTSPPRVLTVLLTTALTSLLCLLVLAPAASARVTIVPGSAQGGATETFAVRLANERSGVATTRLELTFPADVVIPVVEVAPLDGWTATVGTRPVDPPVTVDGEEIDEAAASIVWEGGEVGPGTFEQFLVTAGPLPADGRLVFTAVQGYADGTEERWTDPAEPGVAGAPTIALVPQPAAPAGQPGDTGGAPAESGPASSPVTRTPDAAEGTDGLLWAFLAGGALVVAATGFVVYRTLGRRKPASRPEQTGTTAGRTPERAGRR